MNVAALMLLDGHPLSDDRGELRLALVRDLVERRLPLAPRLRQVLSRSGRGRPVWVDVRRVDVAEHVRSVRVADPGDEAALLAECARLNGVPLPRTRPLWELWLLTGLDDGRVGVLVRLHHVVADGAATIALMGALFDDAVPSQAPATMPSPGPVRVVGHALRSLAGRGLALADLARLGRAPRLSFNRPVRSGIRVALIRADLERARATAHAHGGTVNDVVLTAVAGGTRALLQARDELDPALVLHVSVPASIRRIGEPLVGNRVGIRVVPVPLGEPDPVRRLVRVAGVTRRGKRRPPLQPAGALLQRWMVDVMARQRLINLLVSNLPGPPAAVTFAGAPVLEVFQIGVVQGNVPLSVGVLSYAGQLNIEVAADADIVPDLPVLVAGIQRDLEVLSCARRLDEPSTT
jgi:WS/DGAT/MGAT family acyltransferase